LASNIATSKGTVLKRVLVFVLQPLVLLVAYIAQRIRHDPDSSVVSVVRMNAIKDSANFVSENLDGCMLLENREHLWEIALEAATVPGAFVELGVWTGESINYMARMKPNAEFFGFDSFEGLAENWSGTSLGRGYFDVKGVLPVVPDNVTLISGWFESTLPDFINNHPDPFAFVHFDADTYESTKLALDAFSSRIVAGSVLVFDEFHGYPNWRNGEFKAWSEFVESRKLNFRYIAFSRQQAALVIFD
jgi:hypothetical protein